jgi:hypothetical protein
MNQKDIQFITRSIMETLVSGFENFDISFTIDRYRIKYWTIDAIDGHEIIMNVHGPNESFAFRKFNGIISGPYAI